MMLAIATSARDGVFGPSAFEGVSGAAEGNTLVGSAKVVVCCSHSLYAMCRMPRADGQDSVCLANCCFEFWGFTVVMS